MEQKKLVSLGLDLSDVRIKRDLPDKVLVAVIPDPDRHLGTEGVEGSGGEDVEGAELAVFCHINLEREEVNHGKSRQAFIGDVKTVAYTI